LGNSILRCEPHPPETPAQANKSILMTVTGENMGKGIASSARIIRVVQRLCTNNGCKRLTDILLILEPAICMLAIIHFKK